MKRVVLIISAIILCSCSRSNIESSKVVKPLASEDNYSTIRNNSLIISTLLANDKTINNTIISDFDVTTINGGVVVKNSNGTYSYTPKKGFVGVDIFRYTICNDSSEKYCSTAKVNVTVTDGNTYTNTGLETSGVFNIPTELTCYYSGVKANLSPTDLKTKLKLIICNYTKLSYSRRHEYLYDCDADMAKTNNVILMYTGESVSKTEYMSGNNRNTPQTFNTEHVYPKSKLTGGSAPKSDLHHLRSCNGKVNSQRGNSSFTDGSGRYKNNRSSWFPGDEWKGDVARMVMYLNVMYNESFSAVGTKELFLKWNKEDPVSAFEKQRNEEIYKSPQHNRNPFIDNPYLATLIYGGDPAENLWK